MKHPSCKICAALRSYLSKGVSDGWLDRLHISDSHWPSSAQLKELPKADAVLALELFDRLDEVV